MKQKHFAYLIFSCSRPEALQFDWSDWSVSDIFAAFIESEEQAEVPADLWTFDWEEHMDRIAPVQLALGWDPRPYILSIFQRCGIEPLYRHSGYRNEDEDQILYFDRLPDAIQLEKMCMTSSATEILLNSADKKRFDEVIQCTTALSRSQNRGMLFIGAWGSGQPYDNNFLFEVEHILRAANMKFFTRYETIVAIPKLDSSQRSNDKTAKVSPLEKSLEQQEKCMNHLKQICLATIMYAQDHDDYLPNAKKWCDKIAVYHASNDGILSCPASNLSYGYAMNLNLSSVNREKIREPHRTVLFYESDLGNINAHDVGESLPYPVRHFEGSVFAFADGHVEVLSGGAQSNLIIKWEIE